jgi:hypothetical protein
MKISEISNLRLQNQQLINSKFKTAQNIVGWMGAMQAQDFEMAKWAVGIRLSGSTEKVIESAINNGEIIRTHLMRPTWHFVSSDDIYWMFELTAPQIKASMKFRDKQLELTDKIYKKSNSIIERSLKGNNHLSREELISELKKAKIAVDMNRASHLLMRAELDGIVCSGIMKDRKPTFALLGERVIKKEAFSKEEALVRLAKTYFTSHGPATIQDFAWWSGLTVFESKQALEMVKSELLSESLGQNTFWFSKRISGNKTQQEKVYLLPSFDEYIISYKDRSAIFPHDDFKKAVSNNGVFRPVIIINGQVAGIWKRVIKKDKIIIELRLFYSISGLVKSQIEIAATNYAYFIDKKTEIKYV